MADVRVAGTDLEPVRIEGTPVTKIYGGDKLGAPIDGVPIGEVWTISTRPEAPGHVASGRHAGETLLAYLEETGAAGIPVRRQEDFPVLVKKLNSRQNASVQVHPDDAYAQAHGEPYGKTELWVYDEPEPGSNLYYGVEHSMTPDEFARSIEDGTICDHLHVEPAYRGAVFFNTAGTIHSAGPGSLFWEIQQNSNTTYRIYDFGRLGADGKPRELHIERAKEVANLEPESKPGPEGDLEQVAGGTRQLLGSCSSFSTWRYAADGTGATPLAIPVAKRSFVGLIVALGTARLTLGDWSDKVAKDDTLFVPAQDATIELACDEPCEVLVITLGE